MGIVTARRIGIGNRYSRSQNGGWRCRSTVPDGFHDSRGNSKVRRRESLAGEDLTSGLRRPQVPSRFVGREPAQFPVSIRRLDRSPAPEYDPPFCVTRYCRSAAHSWPSPPPGRPSPGIRQSACNLPKADFAALYVSVSQRFPRSVDLAEERSCHILTAKCCPETLSYVPTELARTVKMAFGPHKGFPPCWRSKELVFLLADGIMPPPVRLPSCGGGGV
jgi:hypothetical protein